MLNTDVENFIKNINNSFIEISFKHKLNDTSNMYCYTKFLVLFNTIIYKSSIT